MKRIYWLPLMFILSFMLVGFASALRWPTNASYRVTTMGDAALAIEDETTALTIFNHQNPAGLALNKKENRIDVGLDYLLDSVDTEYPVLKDSDDTTTLELIRPGAEYRGLTYWLGDQLVVRAGIEGMLVTNQQTKTPIVGGETKNALNLSGLGGGASVAYKTESGLAFGGGISYLGAGGELDNPAGLYDIYSLIGGTTDKVEVTSNLLNWGVGVGYELADLGESGNKLTFGVAASGVDDKPEFAGVLQTGVALGAVALPMFLGGYNTTIESTGNVSGFGDFSAKSIYCQSPVNISAEAIYDLGSMLEAGLFFDYTMRDVHLKTEYSQEVPSRGLTNNDYKLSSASQYGITPVMQANIPVGEGMALLPGISFSNYGTGSIENFSLDTTTADKNDTYQSSQVDMTKSNLGVGLGLQAMGKALQLAVQYESGSYKYEGTNYLISGTVDSTEKTEGSNSNIRFGAEYWLLPIVALRAGYAILADTLKDGAVDSNGNPTDLTTTTGRLTFGAGLALLDGTTADLLVRMDTVTSDPKQDPEPKDTGLGIMLALKIMI